MPLVSSYRENDPLKGHIQCQGCDPNIPVLSPRFLPPYLGSPHPAPLPLVPQLSPHLIPLPLEFSGALLPCTPNHRTLIQQPSHPAPSPLGAPASPSLHARTPKNPDKPLTPHNPVPGTPQHLPIPCSLFPGHLAAPSPHANDSNHPLSVLTYLAAPQPQGVPGASGRRQSILALASWSPGSKVAAMHIPESLQDLADSEAVQFLKRPKTILRIFAGVRSSCGPATG